MASKQSGEGKGSAARKRKSGASAKKHKKNKFDLQSKAASIMNRLFAGNSENSAKQTAQAAADKEPVRSGRIGETLNTSQMKPYAEDEPRRTHSSSGTDEKQRSAQRSGGNAGGFDGGSVNGDSVTLAEYLGEYTKKLWFRVMLAVMLVFFLMYIAYQIYLNFYSDIKIEVAAVSTYSETIDTEGFAVRSETVIQNTLSGAYVSAVKNGGKVSKDQTVINVFKSSDSAAAYTRIAEIDSEIAELQSMATASEDSATEVTNIEKQLDVQINKLAKSVNEGNISEVSAIKSNITYLMNKRLIAMRKVEDYQARIDELNKEKTSLQNSYKESPTTIKAPASGYYVNSLDGYENLLTKSMLQELTADKLESIMSQKASVIENSAGKLITDFSWYLACPVSKKEAEDYLAVSSIYTLILPYSETGSVKGTLVYLNEGEGDKLLAVFECYSLLSELCSMRSQPVKIQIKSYTGFNVKKSALHVYSDNVEVKNEKGEVIGHKKVRYPCVYVIVGNQVVARRVDIVYNGENFAICGSKSNESGYLTLYDKIITEGKGLYAGKIIN